MVEVALIRPGPIQGGSVHPYLRRRNGEEAVTYPHPLLEECLEKTLGVPLFQEQLMQMAIDVAGFTPGESDQLRQAMGSKRSRARMAAMRERLFAGMAERGITGDVAEEIANKLEAFADFGFPESHSVSFAYLVYSSSWIKLHYPAEFACALLNAQPMGFYSPHTIVRDAIRHGVEVLGPVCAGVAPRLHARAAQRGGGAGRHAPAGLARRPVDPRGADRAAVRARPRRRAARPHRRRTRASSRSPTSRTSPAAPARPPTRSRRSPPPGRSSASARSRRSALWAAGALRDARLEQAARAGHRAPRRRRCRA